MPKEPIQTTTQARLQNDYGADLWVKNQAPHRVCLPYNLLILPHPSTDSDE